MDFAARVSLLLALMLLRSNAADDSCRTVSGPDTGSPCMFPFIWGGATYTSCVQSGDIAWCLTGADATSDSGWGVCNNTSSRLQQTVQLKSIILITIVALIVCCNCYEAQSYQLTKKKEMTNAVGQNANEMAKKKYMRLVSEYKIFKRENCKHFRFNSTAHKTHFGNC